MHNQLETYRSDFLALKDEATSLVDGVAADTLRQSPDPETWSFVQVFDHMIATGEPLLGALETAIQNGREKGLSGTPPFEYGFVSRWFVHLMKPSSDWSLPAPSMFEPKDTSALVPREVLEDFRSLQDQFAGCVADADGLDLRRLRVPSPAFPLLRISLGAWFEATLAHQRRHLNQARDIIQELQDET